MTENEVLPKKKYNTLDPRISKKYNERFVKSMCAIDDLLLRKRYLYDLSEENGDMIGLIDLLNSLNDENEQLKEENQSWLKTASRMNTIHHEDREYCEKLYKENEQLKQIISNYEKAIDKVFDNIVFADKNAIQSLKKQLKEELKE